MKEIKNLRKVSQRIKKAINSDEKIILYGDADLDGTCSVIILEECIRNLEGKVEKIYFPDREREGYGINKKALKKLESLAPALLISVDCGIGNFEEVKVAKEMGFEVIIIDHHKILGNIPDASLVVDPKQEGDEYPFKEFANTGIVYKLAKVLLGRKLKGSLDKSFLELTALATIADMMIQTDENKLFIMEGLNSLVKTVRPGLRAFWGIGFIKRGGDMNKRIAGKITSVLNAASNNKNNLTESYVLLIALDEEKAEKAAKSLIEKQKEKKAIIDDITWDVKKKALKDIKKPIIFEGDSEWPLASTGSVASKICREFDKPVFIFRKKKNESKGAVRTPRGVDSVEAMESCADLLETFGGHSLASGFTIKNNKLKKFEACLINYFNKL
jgi:single-stranded-DNA-specific exonuclease